MAFLSDIHGNATALDAVLSEIGRLGIVDIYVAGDLLLGGDGAVEVWRTLQRIKAKCVRGPTDRALAIIAAESLTPSSPEERLRAARFRDTQKALGDLVLRQLARLPEEMRVPMVDGRELLMVHGSPRDATDLITHELDDEEINALIADDPADILICGGTHVSFHRRIGEIDVVNVGSVGEAPEGRIAHYTIVQPKLSGATIEQTYLEY